METVVKEKVSTLFMVPAMWNFLLQIPDLGKYDVSSIKVVITAAGDPALYTERLKKAGCKVIHVVPTSRLAERAEDEGVDAVIAEGFESGGAASPYEIGTLALIPRVADSVRIPVIAAGGITDARGYLAALVLGASGVSLRRNINTVKETIEEMTSGAERIFRELKGAG